MMKNPFFEFATRAKSLVWIETVLFAAINVLAFFDNLLICFAVCKNHRLRTPPNMFVIALTVSDIQISTCCTPFTVTSLFYGHRVFGKSFCSLQGFGVYAFSIVSFFTMGINAVSRYFCVVKPAKYRMLFTKKKYIWFTLLFFVVWLSLDLRFHSSNLEPTYFSFIRAKRCVWSSSKVTTQLL